MYTIKRASQLTGVSEASLRTWERRYEVFAPRRNASGYRLYDQESLALISRMRQLVSAGWGPAEAAEAIRAGGHSETGDNHAPPATAERSHDEATGYQARFLAASVQMDSKGLEESLDAGFALGTFEHVVDSWLFPALVALGEGWAAGQVDVAGEHLASQAVHRRLCAAFNAAGSRPHGPPVVVALPPGSRHELGALAFATAIRRAGMDVVYLGADVPVDSWERAVRAHRARAAILAIVTPEDRPAALAVMQRLAHMKPVPLICAGGAAAAELSEDAEELPRPMALAVRQLDELITGTGTPARALPPHPSSRTT